MIKIKEAVVVEGKYDKIKLSALLDTLIIETNGFGVYKEKERLSFIKKIAGERGVVILTDSDHAGFQIRSYLSGALPKEQVKHAYIPDVFGKERRKEQPSKEGKLGVEGMERAVLLKALENAGVFCLETERPRRLVTNADLYNDGFSGRPDSKARKKTFLKFLDLPQFLSTGSFLQTINSMMDYEAYQKTVERFYFQFNCL